ncbi:MAG TPA: hypothetical protein VGD51_09425, partial [Nocardioidaceae bacterium]
MSAMPFDHSEQPDDHDEPGQFEETAVAATPVVVRRNAAVAALVGAAASSVAIAYLWRASQTATVLDWTLCGVMALIAGFYLASLVDSRTPLLVADDLGVRIRLGNEWRGLPWEAIGQVVVHPRKGMLRDGRIIFVPRSLARALDGLDTRGRRHAALNQKMYGAALAVPVGSTTRVAGSGDNNVVDQLSALTLGRAEVVELDPATLEVVDRSAVADPGQQTDTASGEPEPAEPRSRGLWRRRDTKRSREDRVDVLDEDGSAPEARVVEGPATPAPGTDEPSTHAADQDIRETTESTERAIAPAGESGRSDAAGDTAWSEADDAEDRAGTDAPIVRAPRRSVLGGLGTIVS